MIRLRRHVHPSTSAIAALAILLAVACEHEPALTTPEPAETPRRRADVIPPDAPPPPPPPGRFSGTLGSGNSMTGFGPVVLGEIPERTWVEVQISGIMDLFHAYPPELEGQPAGQVDPAGIHHGDSATCWAAIQVRSLEGAFVRHCDFYNNTPLQETWTASVPMKGEVHARRFRGPHKGALRCDYPIEIPCYTLQGIQTVTITPSADELEVRADTNNIAPGTPVTFTASTRDGSPFTVQEWIWAEVSSPSDTTGPYHTVCSTGQTCTYAPTRSGTMYVRAEVNDWIEQASVGVTVVQPALMVECTPDTVTRGDLVSCRSWVEPAGVSFEVTGWTFTGGAIEVLGPGGATTWAGPMVVSGTVSVTADIDGRPDAASAQATVTPRNWQGRDVEMRVENIIPPGLPPNPEKDDQLGITDPHVLFYPGGGWFSQIGEGPNTGLVYVVDMPVFAMADVHINYPAFEPGSAFLNGQTGPPDYCTSQEVAAMLPKIEAHEGLNMEPDSHVGWFKAKTVELAGPSFEPLVTTDLSSMVAQGTAVRTYVDQEALSYSESFDDGHPVEISCEINWNYPTTLIR